MGIRIKDIAKLAEVSPATVSLVLNDRPGVGEETREKIRRIAKEQNYQGPKNADQASGRTDKLLFLHIARHGHALNRDHDVFIADYIEGLGQGAKALAMSLEVLTFKTTPIEKIIAMARESEAAGVVALGTELSAADVSGFSDLGKPIVFIDTFNDFMPFDFVDMNNEDSAYTIVSHLAARGHRRIGFIGGAIETPNFKLRAEGFRTSLGLLGLDYDPKYSLCVDSTFHGAHEDMKAALERGIALPSAYFCANDIIACGCIKALKEAKIRVPDDVSIVGFDDLPLSAVVDPPLTTVKVSKAQIGRMAVQILTDRVRADGKTPPVKVLISGELVSRRSVADLTDNGDKEDQR